MVIQVIHIIIIQLEYLPGHQPCLVHRRCKPDGLHQAIHLGIPMTQQPEGFTTGKSLDMWFLKIFGVLESHNLTNHKHFNATGT